jgi:hypothetical protein
MPSELPIITFERSLLRGREALGQKDARALVISSATLITRRDVRLGTIWRIWTGHGRGLLKEFSRVDRKRQKPVVRPSLGFTIETEGAVNSSFAINYPAALGDVVDMASAATARISSPKC